MGGSREIMGRRACALAGILTIGCSVETGGSGGLDASADGSGDASASETDPSATSSTATASAGDADGESAGETGFLFDVANGEGTGNATDTGPWTGGCRESEHYGAAGGYPHFADPAYDAFLDKQVLVMTSHAYTPAEPVVQVIDISGDPPPPNQYYAAPAYRPATWVESAFGGGIFGLTLDSAGNIYVAPSTIYGLMSTTPGTIYKIDGGTGVVSQFATIPNNGPAFGNINYDCTSETLYAVSHEDCRIYQFDMAGNVRSTYHHGTGDVTMGLAADPGEPDGVFCPLGERMWGVQSHYGRLYYAVWWEDSGRQDPGHENEIWSVGYVDEQGVPDGATKELEATVPGLQGNTYSNPVSDLSFAASGWMLVAERTMYGDTQTVAHQSTTYEFQQSMGIWQNVGTTYVIGELPNSSAGGVDHDFEEGGYVWATGDALDFYTNDVVYGVQGTPYGGGDITNSTLIDHDGDIVSQHKGALGDCEIPIPGDAMPPPPPPEG